MTLDGGVNVGLCMTVPPWLACARWTASSLGYLLSRELSFFPHNVWYYGDLPSLWLHRAGDISKLQCSAPGMWNVVYGRSNKDVVCGQRLTVVRAVETRKSQTITTEQQWWCTCRDSCSDIFVEVSNHLFLSVRQYNDAVDSPPNCLSQAQLWMILENLLTCCCFLVRLPTRDNRAMQKLFYWPIVESKARRIELLYRTFFESYEEA